MKSKTVLAVLLAMVLVAMVVASAAAASPSQTVATDTPTATSTESTVTPSPTPTVNPCVASSSGTSTGGGTSVAGGTPTGGSEGDTGGNSGSQPVAEALCNFFNGNLGLTYSDIMGLHSDGFGFGEIAQACWMALELQQGNTSGGTTPTCQQILDAKQGNNIGSLNLGASNWGQLKKLVLGKFHGLNLGAVVSGRAVGLFNGTSFPGSNHGNGQGNGNGNGHGNGNGNGNGNGGNGH